MQPLNKAWLQSKIKERLDSVVGRPPEGDDERFVDMIKALWVENQRLTQGDKLRSVLRNGISAFGHKPNDEKLRVHFDIEFSSQAVRDKFISILYDLTEPMDNIVAFADEDLLANDWNDSSENEAWKDL